jgi:peptidoglycan hydrolase-like amidase
MPRLRPTLLNLLSLLLFCSVVSTASSATVSQQLQALVNREGQVRIGLGKYERPINITAPNGLLATATLANGTTKNIRAQNIEVQARGVELLVSADGIAATCKVLEVVSPNGREVGANGKRYWGALEVANSEQGRLVVVNRLPLDDYIACVLKAEIGPAPYEALKAQAVVARSEVIHKIEAGRHKKDGFDLCSGEHCMAYSGCDGVTPDMKRAALETRGLVLMADGQVLDAVFHTMCGGVTAGAEDVWDSPHIPGLEPIWDSARGSGRAYFSSEDEVARFILSPSSGCFCDPAAANFPSYARKYYRWTRSLDAVELRQRCGGTVLDIRILERRSSGRVRKLEIVTTNGSRVIEKELPIRRLFDLPSGLFLLRVVPGSRGVDSVEFTGAGSGQGVGMCQMGAWSMAEKGFSYEAILRHYFPTAKLGRLY